LTRTIAPALEQFLERATAPLLTARVREQLSRRRAELCRDVDLHYLEFRVSTDEADQVDVSASAASALARRALAEHARRRHHRQPGDTWDRPAQMLELWSSPGSELSRSVSAACLEYDVDPECQSIEPSLFLNVSQLSHSGDRLRSAAELARLLEHVVGSSAAASYQAYAAPLLGAVPENFHLAHLGFMFARAAEAVRFCVALPRASLSRFLRDVGWSGDLGVLEASSGFAERAGWVSLGLGVSSTGVCPRLGVEVPVRARAERGEQQLLEELVQRQLCTPLKSQALQALLAQRDTGLVRFQVSHAKLVLASDGTLVETKLYLTLPSDRPAPEQRWHSFRQLHPPAGPAERA
jgi:hypothetical protein